MKKKRILSWLLAIAIVISSLPISALLPAKTVLAADLTVVAPNDATVVAGNTAEFTVEASGGTEPYTYQWEESTDSAATWNAIDGATSATYTIDSTTIEMDNYQYRCVVQDATEPVNTVTSDAALLRVNEVFALSLLQNLTANAGESATFSITASGGIEPYTYQWQTRVDSQSDWVIIDGATDAAYVIEGVNETLDGTQYQCIVRDGNLDPLISEVSTLTVMNYEATAVSDDPAMGTVTVAFVQDNTWTISAEANEGYIFKKWSDDNTEASRTVTLTEDTEYTAYFIEAKSVSVTWNENANAQVELIQFKRYIPNTVTAVSRQYITPNFTYNKMESGYIYDFKMSLKEYDTENYIFDGWIINGEFIPISVLEKDDPFQVELQEDIGINIFVKENLYIMRWSNSEQLTYMDASVNSGGTPMDILDNIEIELVFTEIAGEGFTATVVSDDESMGTVSAEAIEKNKWKLTVSEIEDYKFVSWSDGSTDEEHIVYLKDDTTYTAYFTENSIPTRKPDVPDTVERNGVEGVAYSLDLSTVFEDINRDVMTYTVSIDGADAVSAEEMYTFQPDAVGEYVLAFWADDGIGTSEDTYTLILTVAIKPEVEIIVDDGVDADIQAKLSVYEEGMSVIDQSSVRSTSCFSFAQKYLEKLNSIYVRIRNYDADYYIKGWYIGDEFIAAEDVENGGVVSFDVYTAVFDSSSKVTLYNSQETSFIEALYQYDPTTISTGIVVEPVFEKIDSSGEIYTMTVISDDETMGTVSATNIRDNTWRIEAIAADGYASEMWSDGKTGASRMVTIDKDTELTAFFVSLKEFSFILDEASDAVFELDFEGCFSTAVDFAVFIDEQIDTSYFYDELRPDLRSYSYMTLKSYDDTNYDFEGFIVNGEFISINLLDDEANLVYNRSNDKAVMFSIDDSGVNVFLSLYNDEYRLYIHNYATNSYRASSRTEPQKIISDITVEPVFASKTTQESFTPTVVSNDDSLGSVIAEQIEGNLWKLTATPMGDANFIGWDDGCIYGTHTVLLKEDKQFTANFEASLYTLTVNSNIEDSDAVWIQSISLGNEKHKLETGAYLDYEFVYWEYEGEQVSTSNIYSVILDEDAVYTACFVQTVPELTGDYAAIQAAADKLYYPVYKNQYNDMNGASDPHAGMPDMMSSDLYKDNIKHFSNSYTGEALSGETVDAYDNVIMSFSISHVIDITKDITVNVYAGDTTSGELLGTAAWNGMLYNQGLGLVKVAINSMPCVEYVTVEMIVDGLDSPIVKTYTVDGTVTDTGFLTERGEAVAEIRQAYSTYMDMDFSIYSSEYLMINDVYADGIEEVKNATSAEEITLAKEKCLNYMQDASSSIYHTGVNVGINMGYGLQVVTVPEEVDVGVVMCAALEQAWPGKWYLSVNIGQFGWWINGAGIDGTGEVHFGPQTGGATYDIMDETGIDFFANGVSNQKVWSGLLITWRIWDDEEPAVILNSELPGTIAWDLAKLRMSYSDEYLTTFDVFKDAVKHCGDDPNSEIYRQVHNALRKEFFDFLSADMQEETKQTVLLIMMIDLENSDVQDQIDAARTAYNALMESEQVNVFNYRDLTDAELAMLVGDPNAQDAYRIDLLIEAIRTVNYTQDSFDRINDAMEAYDSATLEAKSLVERLDELVADRATFNQLAENAVSTTEVLIDEIPFLNNLTYPNDADAVQVAKDAFDILLEAEREGFDAGAKNKLDDSVVKMSELKRVYVMGNLSDMYNNTGAWLYNTVTDPIVGSVGGEWTILGLARSEYAVSDLYYTKYYSNVVIELEESGGVLSETKYTEYSRLIIALTSIGENVTDVSGYNLLEYLSNYDNIIKQGLNGPIFALIALDTAPYEIPKIKGVGTQTTRDNLIGYILNEQLPDGGWAYSGDKADVDMTAMVLQALARYYDTNTDVKIAVDKALDVLSGMQKEDGGFLSWGSDNLESNAQVLTALCALGINPATDERFTKDGNTVLTAMSDYYVAGGGFGHADASIQDLMATDQGYYALTAYSRLIENKTSLYDMSDVLLIGDNEKADRVIDLIDAIGTVTLDSETAINNAITAYNALNSKQKALVTNYTTLQSAIAQLSTLKIAECERLINAIGTVTLDKEDTIVKARTYYTSLSDDEQKKVDNYDKLTAAEEALKELKTEKPEPTGSTKSVTVTINDVTYEVSEATANTIEVIEELLVPKAGDTALPEDFNELTEEQVEDILSAYRAYEALTDDEKLFVENYEEFEAVLEKLGEEFHYDDESGVDVRGNEVLPWNVKINVQPQTVSEEQLTAIRETLGKEADMMLLCDIHFTDMLTGNEYEPQALITVRIPVPDSYDGSGTLAVVHIKDDGSYEYIKCTVTDGYAIFSTASFSLYGIASFTGDISELLSQNTANNLTWIWIVLAVLAIGGLTTLIFMKKRHNVQS